MDYLKAKLQGVSDLCIAAKAGDIARVRLLVMKEDVNRAGGHEQRTPLMHAAAGGHDVIIGELLDRQAATWHVDTDGHNALHLAAMAGAASSIAILLGPRNRDSAADKAAFVASRDKAGFTALHLAVVYGYQTAMDTLLKHGADVNSMHQGLGYTSLHLAAEKGHVQLIPALVGYGARLEARTVQTGSSALHVAALAGQLDVLRALLQLGANTGAKDNWGRTPLEAARQANQSQAANIIKDFMLGPSPAGFMPGYPLAGGESRNSSGGGSSTQSQPYNHYIPAQPQPQAPVQYGPPQPPQVQVERITIPAVAPQANKYPTLPPGAGAYY